MEKLNSYDDFDSLSWRYDEMILSVSRRTDIPSCYPEWFMNRLRDKYVLTRNPMNIHQVSRVDLSPDFIECIVFWTKNAIPFMNYLAELDRMGYVYMFQYTVTPYDCTIERNIPDKEKIVKNILELSQLIGRKRMVWRYDPILLNSNYTINCHIKLFEEMCRQLCMSVNHVIISFVDLYRKNSKYILRELSLEEIEYLAQAFGKISEKYNIPIHTCCEHYDLTRFGITQGSCIDTDLLGQICNRPLKLKKSVGQRKECLCSESIDIGTYHTCKNGCIYCYATDYKQLNNKCRFFDESGQILCDRIDYDKDIIKVRKMKKL